jgi:hypothetical protein
MFNNGFKPTVQKLLYIEQFCQKKFNKIKTKSFKEIRAIGKLVTSGILGDFKKSRPKVKEIF